jgi:hypothetical protein
MAADRGSGLRDHHRFRPRRLVRELRDEFVDLAGSRVRSGF